MNTAELDKYLEELGTEKPVILEIMEGFIHQLEQADLEDPTRKGILRLQAKYEALRVAIGNLEEHLNQAKFHMMVLLDLGFPALPEEEMDERSLADLDQNTGAITDARAQFTRRLLTTIGTSTVGEEEPI